MRLRLTPRHAFAAITVALGALAYLVHPHGLSPDDAGWHRTGAILYLLFFLASLVQWGELLGRGWLRAVAFGSAALAAAGFAFGMGPGMGWGPQFHLMALLLAPSLALAYAGSNTLRFERKTHVALIVGVSAAIVLAALVAANPQGHPDPLYYNLLGPRLWVDSGISLPSLAPITFQCSYWDYLYMWGQALLGGPHGAGLIEGQLFAQGLHTTLGIGGCALAASALLEPYTRSRTWHALAVLAAATSAALLWTAPLAKNDLGAAFWVLAGFALALDGKQRTTRGLVVGGIIAGMGLSSKLTTAFTVLPLFLLFSRLREATIFGAGLVGALVPIALRNYLATGNPVFPTLDSVFHSPELSPVWQLWVHRFQGSGLQHDPYVWRERLKLLISQNPFVLLVAALPLLRSSLARLAGVTWIALLLFFAFAGRAASLRLAGPSLVLACGLGPLIAGELVARFSRRRTLEYAAAAAVFLVTLICARLPWSVLTQFTELTRPAPLLIRQSSGQEYDFAGGEAQAWLRLHTQEGDRIAVASDTRLYYISHLNLLALRSDPRLAPRFEALTTPERLAQALHDVNARYLLVQPSWFTDVPDPLYALAEKLAQLHPRAIAFTSAQAKVLDLSRL